MTIGFRQIGRSSFTAVSLIRSQPRSAAAEISSTPTVCAAKAATDGPYMRSRVIYGIEAEVIQGFLNLRGQPTADWTGASTDSGWLAF